MSAAWLGVSALACAAGVLAAAFTGAVLFLHAGVPAGLRADAWLREAGCFALALVGALLARAALRRGGRAATAAGVAALALLAPLAADALAAPLVTLLPARAVRLAYLFLAGLLFALVWVAGTRAWARSPASPRPRWTSAAGRWLGRVALAAGSTALALGAGELLLRAQGTGARAFAAPMILFPGDGRRVPYGEINLFLDVAPPADGLEHAFKPWTFYKGWYDRPTGDYFHADGSVDYIFNSHGLRDHEFALDKPEGEFRVLAMGDSFTFGAGVPLDDCWTEVLERGLSERLGRPAQVINAGFAGGNDPSEYDAWIARDGLRLKPDVVIVAMCLNDMNHDVSLYAFRPRKRPRPLLDGRSNLLNALQAALLPPPAPRVTEDWTAVVQRKPDLWQKVQQGLRHTHAVLSEHGIRLLVVPLPMMSGLRDGYPYAGLHELVARFCAEEQIEALDLLPRFLGRDDAELQVHPSDQHPNDVGHRLIAEGLLERLAPP
jgi:lysophospholipase L1-like esterase